MRQSRPRPCRGGWRFTYAGKQYWRKREEDAWSELRRLRKDAVRPDGPAPLTVADLIDRWEEDCGSDYANRMLDSLDEWRGDSPLDDLPDDFLDKYRKHLRKTSAQSTVRTKVYQAACVLRWGAKRGFVRLPDVPEMAKPAAMPKALSATELEAFLNALNKTEHPRRGRNVARFILETGCRPSEARRLKWAHIDLEHRTATFPPYKTQDKDADPKPRVVPLNDEALALVQAQPRINQWVFLTRKDRPFTRDGFSSICQRRGVAPYRLRHTWCQRMADMGVAESVIAEIMGHGSLAMIRMYRRISNERTQAAAAQLCGLSRPKSPPCSRPGEDARDRKRTGKLPRQTDRTVGADASAPGWLASASAPSAVPVAPVCAPGRPTRSGKRQPGM